MGEALDPQRCVRLQGLPLSVLYDREGFEAKVRELLAGTFALKPDHIVAVHRNAVLKAGKEVDVEALVRCTSRIQKNLIFLNKDKLASPIKVLEFAPPAPKPVPDAVPDAADDAEDRLSGKPRGIGN